MSLRHLATSLKLWLDQLEAKSPSLAVVVYIALAGVFGWFAYPNDVYLAALPPLALGVGLAIVMLIEKIRGK